MRRDVDTEVRHLAYDQHGAFARWQVLAHGGDDRLIARRLRSGAWSKVAEGVYVLAGLPPDPERALWAAWLAVGPLAHVSHEAAGERHGLHPVLRGRFVFSSTHGDHRRLPGIVVHQLRDVADRHLTVVGGLPTTTVARTVVDLAAVSSVERLARIVENAVNERRTTDVEIGIVVGDVNRRGKWGMQRITTVLARRSPGEPVTDSELEGMLLAAVVAGGNPVPVAQFPHPGRQPGKGRVDFAYPGPKVILEADGRRWHQRIADLKRDRARDNEAARAGWLTMRFMWEELASDPHDVGTAIAEAIAHRRPPAN